MSDPLPDRDQGDAGVDYGDQDDAAAVEQVRRRYSGQPALPPSPRKLEKDPAARRGAKYHQALERVRSLLHLAEHPVEQIDRVQQERIVRELKVLATIEVRDCVVVPSLLAAKVRAIELLMRHWGMLTERVEVVDGLEAKLRRALDRVNGTTS